MHLKISKSGRLMIAVVILVCLADMASYAGTNTVPKYGEREITLTTTNKYKNPYKEVTLSATFTGPTETITMNGFWDGGGQFKIRMMPTEPGTWTWKTSSNDKQLDGKTGSLTCTDSKSKGYVRVSKTHPQRFEWCDGTPFFLMGDTTWHVWYGIPFSDGTFQRYVKDRVAQHFNSLQGVVHADGQNEGGGVCTEKGASGRWWNPDTLNPKYFQWVDKKVDYMNSKGMVAILFFAWGNEGYKDFNREQWLRYEKYMVARYAAKNVFWIIVGEYEEAGKPVATWTEYMDVVAQNDPYGHPISMHCVNTTDALGNVTSQSFVSHQLKGTPEWLRQSIEKSRTFGKPVVNLEYGYESLSDAHRAYETLDELRKDHYAIVLAGGYGVYGNGLPGLKTFHRGDFNPKGTNTPGAKQMKILYEFFAGTNFQKLEPAQYLVDAGICAACPNTEYIVQLLTGGTVTVDLTQAAGDFQADWFDPRTGKRTTIGTVTDGAKRSFTAPDKNDWILHIRNNGG